MPRQTFAQRIRPQTHSRPPHLRLEDGARVAVVGGGPAGSFFSYFLLDMARRAGLRLQVDVYEPRDFLLAGPPGCNMDAGIISESLVQNLASEGIVLPSGVVRRGIDAYALHMDVGSARLDAPRFEKRIAAIYRGAGPRQPAGTLPGAQAAGRSFDAFLLAQAKRLGASVIRGRVDNVQRQADGRLRVAARGHTPLVYDLLVVAAGVKTSSLKLFEPLEPRYRPPATVQVSLRDYRLGREAVAQHFGTTIRAFLLDIPGLDFGVLIPKENYVSVSLLGRGDPEGLMTAFLNSPEVQQCMPPGWKPDQPACHCSPRLVVSGAAQPFADRLVFVGDSGVSRLYKDGIGAAYRAAKAAAAAAVFHGIGEEDFRRHYGPVCRKIAGDNRVGLLIFSAARLARRWRIARCAILQMVLAERQAPPGRRRMSTILWDIFTGSAAYREIFWRGLHPAFWGRLLWRVTASVVGAPSPEACRAAQSGPVLAL